MPFLIAGIFYGLMAITYYLYFWEIKEGMINEWDKTHLPEGMILRRWQAPTTLSALSPDEGNGSNNCQDEPLQKPSFSSGDPQSDDSKDCRQGQREGPGI